MAHRRARRRDRRLGLPRIPGPVAVLCLLLASTLLAPTASGQLVGKACGPEVAGGTHFRFEEVTGANIAGTFCFDTAFKCDQPREDGGPTYQLLDTGCDPTAGPCQVQLRVPLKFPGNQQNIHDGPYHGYEVRWFLQSTPPACDDAVQCGQVSTCGKAGTGTATINTDRAVFTATRSLSCDDVLHTNQPLSLTAWGCITSSCHVNKNLDLPGLDLDGPEVAAQIGCPNPPKQSCGSGDASSCQVCTPAGVGPGFGLPGYGGPGSWATGPGATLRYSAHAAGHPGYPGTPSWNVTLGRYWSHDYAARIVAVGSPNPEDHAWLITKYGTFREWQAPDPTTGVYAQVSPSDEYRTLTWTGAGWTLTDLDGTVEAFDAAGAWRSTTDRNGNQKVATYTAGQLASVNMPDGRREDFTYYPSGDAREGKLASITEVGINNLMTHVWTYDWNGEDLTEIGRPDLTALLFEYDPATGYLAKVRLREMNGAATRVLRAWSYTADGKVAETWKGGDTPAVGTEDWKLSYDSPSQTTVTDPLGQPIVYTYELDPASPNVRVTQIAGDCPVCSLGPNTQLAYADPSNPLRPTATTDGRGFTTTMSYDAHGQVTSRIEASNDPTHVRETDWAYDMTYPGLVTEMDQPSVSSAVTSLRTTEWLRDTAGNVTTRRISGAESGSAFTKETTTAYNPAGEPLTIDPPGYATTDQTSFTYDATGLIALTRTDPLVGTTTFGVDGFNRRISVTDSNGLETRTTYDELDRVTEVRQVGPNSPTDDLVTAYAYTTFGDLFRTTLPAGNVIEYGYDSAGRLTSIERKPDATIHGERVVYTLDAAGDRTREERQRWDAGTSTWVPVSATAYDYPNRCQVDRIRQAPDTAQEATTAFEYDCDGNLVSVWDPDHDRATEAPTTSYAYDSLNRLTSVTQAWAPAGGTPSTAVTSYLYDVQDHLTSVTDAEHNETTYTYSDRDLLTYETADAFVTVADPTDPLVCPPAPMCGVGCGCTAHAYNDHGEEDRSTDARGVVVTRTIDELDRVTDVTYPGDSTLDVHYLYDSAPASCAAPGSPVGRLASITRNGQTIDECYDPFGRTVQDGELGYAWDANGNRTGIVYPSGVSATYGFDFADREVSLDVTTPAGGATPHPVITATAYLPSGPLSSLALGNGTTETRAFDGRYVPTAITLSGLAGGVPGRTWSYTTDRVGNVTEILETPECAGAGSTVLLENRTVTTDETFTSCADLQAGNGFAVQSPGHVTFQAQGKVVLASGFSVGNGASFAAGSGSLPTFSDRTYTYQSPQYFLTSADGPWGSRDWSYDKIGNRLSESRDGGATADSYAYTTNTGGGDTPILDLVNLAVTGTRDYTWDAAANLDQVAAGANVIDFAFDDASRLAAADRTASGGGAAAFLYDGRGFLRSATQSAGGTASVTPLYDSAGLLHALRRQATSTDPVDTTYVFYLAGRPVAQLEIDCSTDAETWQYLTTDHLGTPLVTTDQSAAITWQGGFQAFGTDYQAGTGNGASENGIPLRLPGQWVSDVWADATSGAGIYQNVYRWYAPDIGRYTRPDPLALNHPQEDVYLYAGANPLLELDPLGLAAKICCRLLANFFAGTLARKRHCYVVADDGTKYSLYPQEVAGQTLGVPRTYDSRDVGGSCHECACSSAGQQNRCLRNQFNNYPVGEYHRFGPNSNTFAGTLVKNCCKGGIPKGVDDAPGLNDPPPKDIGLRPVPDTHRSPP